MLDLTKTCVLCLGVVVTVESSAVKGRIYYQCEDFFCADYVQVYDPDTGHYYYAAATNIEYRTARELKDALLSLP